MAICGGAIAGYWETGSFLIDSRPASMTIIAITQAKIGRFMKKRGMEWLLRIRSDKSDSSGLSDYFFAVVAAGALPNATALTGVPGRAFWMPSRMMRS